MPEKFENKSLCSIFRSLRGEKWWEIEQGRKGKRGKNEGKRVGGKGPEISAGTWIGGVWTGHFPESEKTFFQRPTFAEILKSLRILRRKSDLCQISGSEI